MIAAVVMEIKLNLGCGTLKAREYINVDWRFEVEPEVVADVRLLPFRDNSITDISASHIIEHISHREVEGVLRHWIKLLKPMGRLFIACPDIERICRNYGLVEFESWIRQIFGDQDYAGNYHHTGFTVVTLAEQLKRLNMDIADIFTVNGGINCWAVKR